MWSIDQKVYQYKYEIKKSRFIAIIGSISSREELEIFLKKYRQNNATHNCYAYKIGTSNLTGGYNDDDEPSNTAGKSIFQIIEQNNLTNVIVLVIRYFGGIKLGIGGLTRSYKFGTSEVIKIANKLKIVNGYRYTISFQISNIKEVDVFLSGKRINLIEKKFEQLVTYQFDYEEKSLFNDTNFKFEKIIIVETIIFEKQ